MVLKVNTHTIDGRGHPVRFGKEIGRGGEGTVFELIDRPDVVAKIYRRRPDREKTAKLSAMVELGSNRLLRLTTWPVDIVRDRSNRATVGILMPRIPAGFKDIHDLYSPKSRLSEFPQADWRFLVHAAANVARAFAVIHDHGHVIGDVNHGNLVVAEDATVKLIDCDSFQISHNGHHYLCEVGVPTHTPTELQGQPLAGVIRTSNHDAFGLAIVIFQLLFVGRHPFAGRYLANADMPIEKAISEYRFAYGPSAAIRRMQPPPNVPDLQTVSVPVANLFERAFSPDGAKPNGRPAAKDWIPALDRLSNSLRVCSSNASHYYLNTLPSCPWCAIEASSGTSLFRIVVAARATTTARIKRFDMVAIWSQITSVSSPGPLPSFPDKSTLAISVSPEAIAYGKARRRTRNRRGGLILAVGITLLTGSAVLFVPAAIVVLILIAVALFIINIDRSEIRREAKDDLKEAKNRSNDAFNRWKSDASDSEFSTKLKELSGAKSQWEKLENERTKRLEALKIGLRARQLKTYLERHRVDQASIRYIGPSRTATLQSFGIETAADVSYARVQRVPGFGPVITHEILAWRDSVESRFRFDPNKGIDPVDVDAIERSIAARRGSVERGLRGGADELNRIRRRTLTSRTTLHPEAMEALQQLAQAEANYKAL